MGLEPWRGGVRRRGRGSRRRSRAAAAAGPRSTSEASRPSCEAGAGAEGHGPCNGGVELDPIRFEKMVECYRIMAEVQAEQRELDLRDQLAGPETAMTCEASWI